MEIIYFAIIVSVIVMIFYLPFKWGSKGQKFPEDADEG